MRRYHTARKDDEHRLRGAAHHFEAEGPGQPHSVCFNVMEMHLSLSCYPQSNPQLPETEHLGHKVESVRP